MIVTGTALAALGAALGVESSRGGGRSNVHTRDLAGKRTLAEIVRDPNTPLKMAFYLIMEAIDEARSAFEEAFLERAVTRGEDHWSNDLRPWSYKSWWHPRIPRWLRAPDHQPTTRSPIHEAIDAYRERLDHMPPGNRAVIIPEHNGTITVNASVNGVLDDSDPLLVLTGPFTRPPWSSTGITIYPKPLGQIGFVVTVMPNTTQIDAYAKRQSPHRGGNQWERMGGPRIWGFDTTPTRSEDPDAQLRKLRAIQQDMIRADYIDFGVHKAGEMHIPGSGDITQRQDYPRSVYYDPQGPTLPSFETFFRRTKRKTP